MQSYSFGEHVLTGIQRKVVGQAARAYVP